MHEAPNADAETPDASRPFRVGEWDVDPTLSEVRRQDDTRSLEPRLMELLVYLATRAGETVSRQELLDGVWGDRIVVEAVLTEGISQLRRVFGDDPKNPRYIRTVHRRGYRLVAPVEWLDVAAASGDPVTPPAAGRGSSARWLSWLGFGALILILFVLAALRQRQADRTPRTYPSIAVLPFENLSAESEEYLAIGMTDMLITDLAKIPDLKVISYTSAARYGEGGQSVPEFAREVAVEAVLKGSVSRSEEQLRVIVHLLSGETGELLWAKDYKKELVDLLGLQSEISHGVAREIQGQLSLDRVTELALSESVTPEAYREYLKGRLFWNRRNRVDLRKSKAHFEAAIQLAPDFARAHAGLADALIQLSNYTELRPEEALPEAERLVRRALELDPNLAEAHATLGLIRASRDWDWQAAKESYLRAIELQPGYATVHQWYAECLSFDGRHSEALAEVQKAVELDPLSPLMLAVWGQRLNAAGRHREAIDRLEEAVDKDATFSWAHRELAYAYRWLGDVPNALAHRRMMMAKRGWKADDLHAVDSAIAAKDDSAFWRARLELLSGSVDRWVPAIEIAEAHAALGRPDAALASLTRAVEERSEYFPHLIKSPLFDTLAEDPRFVALLEQSGVVRGPGSR